MPEADEALAPSGGPDEPDPEIHLHRRRGRHHRARHPRPPGRDARDRAAQHRSRQAQGSGRAQGDDGRGRSRRALPARRRGAGNRWRWPTSSARARPRSSMPRPPIASRPAGSMALPSWRRAMRRRSRSASRVSNPGCYPTGAIALLRPLVDAGLLAQDHPITINAVSGYSGGGKSMIEDHEAGRAPAFELYGLGLKHKHLPELQAYAKLSTTADLRALGRQFPAGHAGLGRRCISTRCRASRSWPICRPRWRRAMPARPMSRVLPAEAERQDRARGAERHQQAGTAGVRQTRSCGQAVLVARLDNLGKGASGAAVQNIRLMLGMAEG